MRRRVLNGWWCTKCLHTKLEDGRKLYLHKTLYLIYFYLRSRSSVKIQILRFQSMAHFDLNISISGFSPGVKLRFKGAVQTYGVPYPKLFPKRRRKTELLWALYLLSTMNPSLKGASRFNKNNGTFHSTNKIWISKSTMILCLCQCKWISRPFDISCNIFWIGQNRNSAGLAAAENNIIKF